MTVATRDRAAPAAAHDLPLPEGAVETPCFVIYEERVLENLRRSTRACGGVERFMPHVKTHRAPWIVRRLLAEGVTAFKAATMAEIEMLAACQVPIATFAYPAVNPANLRRLVRCARAHPRTEFVGMVDSAFGAELWQAEAADAPANLRARVDLDGGMGRTGATMDDSAVDLACALDRLGRFAGWHLYDGNVRGSREERRARVLEEARAVESLNARLAARGLQADLVAGGSYTFDLWPTPLARHVSPGSWTYSSSQHETELSDLGWQGAAFVLATVVSRHGDTVTLDAGSKAIAPDKLMAERFRGAGEIVLMSEEHAVVRNRDLAIGERVPLFPRHACTTAYLYDEALVRTTDGAWEVREQLGSRR